MKSEILLRKVGFKTGPLIIISRRAIQSIPGNTININSKHYLLDIE
jgi:hypothetical protein